MLTKTVTFLKNVILYLGIAFGTSLYAMSLYPLSQMPGLSVWRLCFQAKHTCIHDFLSVLSMSFQIHFFLSNSLCFIFLFLTNSFYFLAILFKLLLFPFISFQISPISFHFLPNSFSFPSFLFNSFRIPFISFQIYFVSFQSLFPLISFQISFISFLLPFKFLYFVHFFSALDNIFVCHFWESLRYLYA